MRRLLALCAAAALLAFGANGCTALLTGGKKKDPEQSTLESRANDTQFIVSAFHRTSPWTSTNASKVS